MSFDVNTLLLAALLVQLSRLVPLFRSEAIANGRRLQAIMRFFGIADPAALPPSSPSSPSSPALADGANGGVAPNR